jgi:phosphate-selective porin OprO/OprP
MKFTKTFATAAFALLSLFSTSAQTASAQATTVQADSVSTPKFKFSPMGKLLIDGALFTPTGDTFSHGFSLTEVRLGGLVSYGQFGAKIDIGYAAGKFGLRDVYMQYQPNNNHLLRLGYFVHEFGLNAAYAGFMKSSMLNPMPDDYFNATSRNLGLMYTYDKSAWFAAASVFATPENITNYANAQGKISMGAMGRFVYRPFHSAGEILQIGISPRYQGAKHERLDDGKVSAGYLSYAAAFPTKVDNVSMLGATVSNARGAFMLSPELIMAKSRFALESQYYYLNANRRHGYDSYTAHGVYAMLHGLILGDKSYGYTSSTASLKRPNPKSLECVLAYNYVNANDRYAGIFGGIASEYSATFNYYINKYMIARLRYGYTTVHGSAVQKDCSTSIIQARLMFYF